LYIQNTGACNTRFYTNSSEAVRIDSSGNVGIGTTSPSATLTVGAPNASAVSFVSNPVASFGGGVAFDAGSGNDVQLINYRTSNMQFGNGGAVDMTIDSSGNVGIGTSSPAYKLDVNGGADNTILRLLSTDDTCAIILTDNDSSSTITHQNGDFIFNADSGNADPASSEMVFQVDATERMRIDSSGNVGIGATSPTQKLDVSGTDARIYLTNANTDINMDNTANGQLHLDGNAYAFGIALNADGAQLYTNSASRDLIFGVNETEVMRVTNTSVGINGAPAYTLDVRADDGGGADLRVLSGTDSGADAILRLQTLATSAGESSIYFADTAASAVGRVVYEHSTNSMEFWVNGSKEMIIQSAGNVDFLNSVRVVASEGDNPAYTSSTSAEGCELNTDHLVVVRNSSNVVYLNRTGTDGNLMSFYAQGSSEGGISVSGGTVSFVGGHLARWSQLADNTRDTSIVKGTVMTNLDQMAVWHHEAVAAQDAVLDEEGNVVTEAVEAKDAYTEDNEQLNCMAVSSVEGDPNVAGVFVNWDTDDDEFNDMNIAMTGDMVIRIAQGTTVARGDLLMSAGDGTAKPQGDDIVRSKTIAKVTSTHVSHTYDDGSYLVPCVLMAC